MRDTLAHRWWSLGLRLLLSAGLLSALYLVGTRALAQWYFLQPPPQGIQQAIRFDPRAPQYHAALGRFYLRSFTQFNLNQAIRCLETATRLSPARARYWAELGGAYELAARLPDARRAYERAQQLFPNSPHINWQLGNFYIREGEITQALRAFRRVVRADPTLRRQTFALAWRAGAEPALILDEMIPPQTDILLQYLNYLAQAQRLDAARETWARLLEPPHAFAPQAVFPYLDALLRNRRVQELTSAWAALQQRHPALAPQRRPATNLIANGDFENPLVNGGLGWRVHPVEGVVVSVDTLTFLHGAHSLKIQFEGKANLDYYHVFQYVPVQPRTRHHFIAYLRARNITTDSGPRLELRDAYEPSHLFAATQNLLGTSSWSPTQLEFQTGPRTRLLLLRVARPPSRKLDNRIAGTLWVDRVSLNPVD